MCGRSQSSVSLKVLYFSSVTKSFILLLYRTISEVFFSMGVDWGALIIGWALNLYLASVGEGGAYLKKGVNLCIYGT